MRRMVVALLAVLGLVFVTAFGFVNFIDRVIDLFFQNTRIVSMVLDGDTTLSEGASLLEMNADTMRDELVEAIKQASTSDEIEGVLGMAAIYHGTILAVEAMKTIEPGMLQAGTFLMRMGGDIALSSAHRMRP